MELSPEASLTIQQELCWEDIQHRIDIGVIVLQEGLVEYYEWFKTHHYWEDEAISTSVDI